MNAKVKDKSGNYIAIWKTKNYESAQNETYELLINKRIFDPVKLEYSKTLSCVVFLNQSKIKELS